MKKPTLFSAKNKTLLFFLLLPLVAWAAAATITNNGNWSNSGIWSGGNIADNISEDVDWDSNTGEVIIQNGESYTISDMAMNNGNTLTINNGGMLTLGSSSDNHNLSTGNNAVINVIGDLEIWGNLNVLNNLSLNVAGNANIHGDVNIGNGGTIDIQGGINVDGDFKGGNNTIMNVDGTVLVGGNIVIGNGSVLTGAGYFSNGGSCTGDTDFCDGAPLPITLAFFEGNQQGKSIVLNWTTTSEDNFDYFSIQKSCDGINFESIASVKGHGFSSQSILYVYEDLEPLNGVNYYRLKAVDLDGTFEVFALIGVEFFSDDDSLVIYPNPVVNNKFTIESLNQDLNQSITLRDINGNSILHSTLSYGKNDFQLNQSISPGNYLIVISGTGKSDIRKLIIN